MIMSVTRRLPPVLGVGAFANVLKRLHARKRREPVEAEAHGFRLLLDPNEFIDRELLFTPQLYDREMLNQLRRALRPGDVFLDAGAHIGHFTLLASRLVGPGRVVAVDADPRVFAILQHHLEINGCANVTAVNAGLADSKRTLRFTYGVEGLRGVGSFLSEAPGGIEVACLPLYDLLREHGVERLAGAKFDIEGFEYRVLDRYLADAPRDAWPRFVIVERLPHMVEKAGGDVVALLERNGYTTTWSKRGTDHILTLR